MPAQADHIRLGHAIGESDYNEGAAGRALATAMGRETLSARAPREAAVVAGAETILGHNVDPIYGYVGDLHPALGTVGLILSRKWASRAAIGATACDSGGLFGRLGGFAGVAEEDSVDALRSLSRTSADAGWDWDSEFSEELASHHAGGPTSYVGGGIAGLSGAGSALSQRRPTTPMHRTLRREQSRARPAVVDVGVATARRPNPERAPSGCGLARSAQAT